LKECAENKKKTWKEEENECGIKTKKRRGEKR
jgi:hypothetical protein